MKSNPSIAPRQVRLGDPEYPAVLVAAAGEKAPAELWLRGELPAESMVAIVGARQAAAGSLVAARHVATALVQAGWAVVSGGAAGVDGAAHVGAMDAGGHTVVVAGTGIDMVYPTQHAALFDRAVATGGAVLSQFERGQAPTKWTFPARNEVIAGLATTTVVIEAGSGSGALYTAEAALRFGRRLVVLSGSAGCDELARRGVAAGATADDVLALILAMPAALGSGVGAVALGGLLGSGPQAALRLIPPRVKHAPAATVQAELPLPSDPRALLLYRALDATPRDLGEVAALAGLPPGEAMALAVDLEVGGFATRAAGGRYRST